ncbi:MAG: universal stress protein [Desulfobacterales bacterium]|uniref:Universal stress protein n=1 Tax=Candidatus Desulfatibia vada TaxID=2841696 RepID=A0A8J6P1E3_9BACT|nr:universal stress protein [Candidatus Desulfatibia vada]MBL6972098.1 universal stress protein [Desulfobacterales bacterium]
MTVKVTKSIVFPLDGSSSALKSLDYLNLVFGAEKELDVNLFHAVPGVPPFLVEESRKNPDTARQVKELERRNKDMAAKTLSRGKQALLEKGFDEKHIKTIEFHKQAGVARDICAWSENKKVAAIVLCTRGRSRIEAFLMGETANKVLEHSRICPVWMVKGDVRSTGVLIALDNSENALRGVDHAAFMLSGTDCPVTLFYSKRNLFRFFSKEVVEADPELEATWKSVAGREIAPYMQKAKEMLIAAGIEESKITSRMVDGSRSAAADILEAARRFDCGTIVMGRRGSTDVKEYTLGSVSRKVLQDCNNTALWLVA